MVIAILFIKTKKQKLRKYIYIKENKHGIKRRVCKDII